jgi:hypothetical protein
MKPLFLVGMVLIVLGVASLVVPIPHSERQGISAGGMSMSVKTEHSETVSPIISAVLILAGAAISYAGRPGGRA